MLAPLHCNVGRKSLPPFGEGGGFSLGDQAIETEKCQKPTFISAYLSMFVSAIHCRCCALEGTRIWFRPLFAEGNL
jgi:hypothetical protein